MFGIRDGATGHVPWTGWGVAINALTGVFTCTPKLSRCRPAGSAEVACNPRGTEMAC